MRGALRQRPSQGTAMPALRHAAGAGSVPVAFALLAYAVPALIAVQFFLVGLAVFSDGAAWDAHRAVGSAVSVPVLGTAAMAAARRDLRAFRGPAFAVLVLYGLQFVWIVAGREAGSGAVQALHAGNAGLLTAASLFLAARCARRM